MKKSILIFLIFPILNYSQTVNQNTNIEPSQYKSRSLNEMMNVAKQAKENQDYQDRNSARFSRLIDKIVNHANSVSDENLRDEILYVFEKRYRDFISNYDDRVFMSENKTTEFLNEIISIYNQVQEEIGNKYIREKSGDAMFTTFIKQEAIKPKLRNKPTVKADVIYEPNDGEKVQVLKKVSDHYYKVKIKDYTGFISKAFLIID
ncbi:SH3 domain-containing protein [Psychroflexus salis]|uniref:SH3b domain-containing protein n=1 Tax=Psychroflexus salis TaxID=1526574 RepID=A0A917E813_9FLAO|nr:SH3 domain-containing protein [Psychroflexus salis]GGE14060.1 hypothetical protein GCM10010831_14290 [Psychroflexus salis]